MSNGSPIYVLRSPQPAADETGLQTLAEFIGLNVCVLSEPPAKPLTQRPVHIAATCASLEHFQRQPLARAWLSNSLANQGSSLFVTGFDGSAQSLQTIGTLLPGVVNSVESVPADGLAYGITSATPSGMPQFAGLTFGPIDRRADRVFVLDRDLAGVTELITIGRSPAYIKVERGGTSYFLLACAHVLDIDGYAKPGQHPIDRFLRFVPFLAYLRLMFGASCWNNESPSACFIVDDPLLRTRYGFLDFNRLDSCAARAPLSVNIAFIPWNYTRTDLTAAGRFKRSDRRFSISIHGCDHAEAEFGTTDEPCLRRRARLALSRMTAHEQFTGITHNRIMVFPQGVFSKASLKAIDDEGFLAAVNSTIYPVDAAPGDVTFRDLLDVAVEKFGGAPLFLRQYPRRLEQIALDVFLGRQVLLVEHHGFFKRGYGELERYAAFINQIAQGVRWTDLEELCTSASLTRDVPDGVEVRSFGSIVRLTNTRAEPRRFCVSNHWAAGNVESVSWNGRPLEFAVRDSRVVCDVLLDPGEFGVLSLRSSRNGAKLDDLVPSAKHRLKMFVRRHLCELRDNYIDRSTTLSEFARRGKTLLPRL